MYKGYFSSLTKKILILTHYVGGMKDLVHISQSAGPNMQRNMYVQYCTPFGFE